MENQIQPVQLSKDFSPYLKFMYGLNAPESKRQYPRRLEVFLDYLQIEQLTVKEKTNRLYDLITKNDTQWLENQLIKFFAIQNERAQRNEISMLFASLADVNIYSSNSICQYFIWT